ncbi:hypothetical protein [Cobetia sp. UCD-24C]|uniref:hypothetical protein n=1 Tax=Cobetia sp. UCD-24C TaxID=1716176 RepID=UPI00128F344F|nr:hypothetical protein [Cobetia sp. UCD-24C]
MTTYNKLAVAIGLASGMMMASQAHAFGTVNWYWGGVVTTDVNIDVDYDPGFQDPGGLVMVESLQTQVGDVSSTATVNNVTYGTTMLGDPEIEVVYPDSNNRRGGGHHGGGHHSNPDVEVIISYPNAEFSVAKLGELENVAASIGNNASIEADAMINLHNAQVLTGTDIGDDDLISRRGHHGGSSVELEPANISSLAQVSNILNLSVDNSATSVGNNLSATLDTTSGDDVEVDTSSNRHHPQPPQIETVDSVLIADNTQFSFANIYSTATVKSVALDLPAANSFSGPLINNAATSVGNNMSISVGPVTP